MGRFPFDLDPKEVPYAEVSKAFQDSLARRARLQREQAREAKLAEAEKVALGGTKRREGPCSKKRTPPPTGTKSHDKHNIYASHVAKEKGYKPVRGKLTELTWISPEGVKYPFDVFNPQDETEVWEVKTQHEWVSPLGMASAPQRLEARGGFHERATDLEEQRLRGLYIAAGCGLKFRYAVDNCGTYTGLNQTWAGMPPVVYIPYPGEKKLNCS